MANCPHCGSAKTRVYNTIRRSDGTTERTRRCTNCGLSFVTRESPVDIAITVRKRDGPPEPFQRSKLRTSIERSVKELPVHSKADEITDAVMKAAKDEMSAHDTPEISSDRLGQLVLQRLESLEGPGAPLAYVRYMVHYVPVYVEEKDARFLRDFGKTFRERFEQRRQSTDTPST